MTEPTSTHPKVSTWLKHIHALVVDIGPRGPTRAGERQAALYAKATFEKFGLHLGRFTVMERCTRTVASPSSRYTPSDCKTD